MTNILIAEDDPTIGVLLQEVIQRVMSFHALWATSASEALQMAKHTLPDLVLLDYFLPDMNGIEFYDQLQCFAAEKRIPAIMLTANLESIMKDLLERGIIGMRKPFHIIELTSLIEQLTFLQTH